MIFLDFGDFQVGVGVVFFFEVEVFQQVFVVCVVWQVVGYDLVQVELFEVILVGYLQGMCYQVVVLSCSGQGKVQVVGLEYFVDDVGVVVVFQYFVVVGIE